MSFILTLPPDILSEQFANLETVDDVARLLEIDVKRLTYHIYVIEPRKKYTSFAIPKASGNTRHILSPNTNLKIIQQKLNQVLQAVYNPPKTTHGFVVGRSIATNAQLHVKKRYVFNIDLENFFPSINFGRVRGLFMASPYNIPAPAATVLAQICCHKNMLPQGAPTSPVISNMICAKMDRQLLNLAWKEHCVYTRYADDITFSSTNLFFPTKIARWINNSWYVGDMLIQIIYQNGFLINLDKVRMQTYMESQRVTGLITNKRVNVPRKFIRQIRAMLHAWEKFGLQSAELEYLRRYYDGKKYRGPYKKLPHFREVVKGKIEFLGMVRGKDDEIYLRFLEKYMNLSHLGDPVDREQMSRFFGVSPKSEKMLDAQSMIQTGISTELKFDKRDWITKAPFPVATILQAYDALPDDGKDYEYLLKFFEALSEFMGIIQLSGFRNDKSEWDEIYEKLKLNDRDFFERPGFGDWCRLIRICGKKIRKMQHGSQEDKKSLFSAFQTEDSEFFRVLSDRKLAAILEKANDFRNAKAHGGVFSPHDEDKNRELQEMLNEVEDILGDFWKKFQLIQPGSSTRKKGYYLHDYKLLAGSFSSFKSGKIEVKEALFEDELYLYATKSKDVLGLLPLLKIRKINSNISVAYFYNRSKNEEAKFISYYYEAEPEIFVEDEDVLSIISRKQPVA